MSTSAFNCDSISNSCCSDDVFTAPATPRTFSAISDCLFPTTRMQRESTSSSTSSPSSKIRGCSSGFSSGPCSSSCLSFPLALPSSSDLPPRLRPHAGCCWTTATPPPRRKNCHVVLYNGPSCSSLSQLLSANSGGGSLPRVRPVENDYNYISAGNIAEVISGTAGLKAILNYFKRQNYKLNQKDSSVFC